MSTAGRDKLAAGLGALSHTGVMAHVITGFPSRERSIEAARAIGDAGATVLEVQLPFSDPLADGPTILEASHRVLSGAFDYDASMDVLASMVDAVSIPCVAMTYANIPFVRGFDAFARDLSERGVSGVIIPDLPDSEPEFDAFLDALHREGLSYVPVIAPTTDEDGVARLGALADDFVYTVIRLGVTGRASDIGEAVQHRLDEITRITGKPIAAGFGIQSREQVAMLEGHAAMAVVGSAIVSILDGDREGDVGSFVRALLAR